MIDPYRPAEGPSLLGCFVYLSALVVALVVILGACTALAHAGEAEYNPATTEGEGFSQVHWTPDMPPPTHCVMWDDIEAHCQPVPAGMAPRLAAIIECESGWNVNAVGRLGERGLLQLHPVHRQAMERRGFDYEVEPDRLTFAGWLWEQRGWTPTWSCARER